MRALALAVLLGAAPAFGIEADEKDSADPPEPLAGKWVSSGSVAPKYRTSRSVQVFPDGRVAIDKLDRGRESRAAGRVTEEQLKTLRACAKRVAKAPKLSGSRCKGGGSITYELGGRTISWGACQKHEQVKVGCVVQVMALLDKL